MYDVIDEAGLRPDGGGGVGRRRGRGRLGAGWRGGGGAGLGWREPFASGLGMHNIHQNQGDPLGSQWYAENGAWQDGGTVVVRPDRRCCLFLSKFTTQSFDPTTMGTPGSTSSMTERPPRGAASPLLQARQYRRTMLCGATGSVDRRRHPLVGRALRRPLGHSDRPDTRVNRQIREQLGAPEQLPHATGDSLQCTRLRLQSTMLHAADDLRDSARHSTSDMSLGAPEREQLGSSRLRWTALNRIQRHRAALNGTRPDLRTFVLAGQSGKECRPPGPYRWVQDGCSLAKWSPRPKCSPRPDVEKRCDLR
ncbi:DUF2278 family protein [Micromonospora sp. NPDC047620]|uniref:DUF2278 family protein n=1 Tax=Micromonospora sp. NPDC047620 TaxID=3364251 RepID=UPI003710A5DD